MKPVPTVEWYGPSPPWAPAEVQAREREEAAKRAVLAPQPMTLEQIADLVERARSASSVRKAVRLAASRWLFQQVNVVKPRVAGYRR
jgi:hypothetical protein